MVRVVITGVPATGKSTVARLLADSRHLNSGLIPIKKIVLDSGIRKGGEVDVNILARKVRVLVRNKKNYVLEGHLACEFAVPADFVFVFRAKPELLVRRYKKRRYGRQKIAENVSAELLDYCLVKSQENYGKAIYGKDVQIMEIDTTNRTSLACVRLILDILSNKRKKADTVRYNLSKYLKYLQYLQ